MSFVGYIGKLGALGAGEDWAVLWVMRLFGERIGRRWEGSSRSIFNMNQYSSDSKRRADSTGHEIIMRLCDPLCLACLRGGVPLAGCLLHHWGGVGRASQSGLAVAAAADSTRDPDDSTPRPLNGRRRRGHWRNTASSRVRISRPFSGRVCACNAVCSAAHFIHRLSRHSRGGAQPDANPRFRHPKRPMPFRLLKLHCSKLPSFFPTRQILPRKNTVPLSSMLAMLF